MKERTVGTIELHPYLRYRNTSELEIEGYNCKETYITLRVKLPENKISRLRTLSCAIRQLKRMFTEIKQEIENDVERAEQNAREW